MAVKHYRFSLTGYPLEHSRSPLIHQAAFKVTGLHGEYRLLPVAPEENFASILNALRSGELHGLNITIPYKQVFAALADQLTPDAQACGAVNTIYLRDGKIIGDNTDVGGFLTDLDNQFGNEYKNHQAVILGAGGAARAVTTALLSRGWQVSIAARRPQQAEEIKQALSGVPVVAGLHPNDLQPLLNQAALLVNATPSGMFPEVAGNPLPQGVKLLTGMRVYDLVYNPPETQLLKQVRQSGLKATNGLGMLVEQAALAFELWTGKTVPREALHRELRDVL
jgi:shikimate dehydrogenase